MKKIRCNNKECEYCFEANGRHYCSEPECQYQEINDDEIDVLNFNKEGDDDV